jgi:hypothetical protein
MRICLSIGWREAGQRIENNQAEGRPFWSLLIRPVKKGVCSKDPGLAPAWRSWSGMLAPGRAVSLSIASSLSSSGI